MVAGTAAPLTVVGAGPAGLAAAMRLARGDRAVRVVERHRDVGYRFHDDLQGLENWSSRTDALRRLVDLGVSTGFDYRPMHDLTVYDSRLRGTDVHNATPLFYLVRRGPGRGTLDRSLLDEAVRTGVQVCFGRTAHAAPAGAVVATGPRNPDGIVVGYRFRTTLPDQAQVLIADRIAPAGYAYLLVWDGHATVATSLFRELHTWPQALAATVEAFTSVVPGLALSDAQRFGGYGRVRATVRYQDRAGHLFAGEAAGLQDPEWGFGLFYAIRSGHLAAECLLEQRDYPTRAQSTFDRQRVTGLVNRRLFEALPGPVVDRVLRYEARRDNLTARLRRHWRANAAKSTAARLHLTVRTTGWLQCPCPSPCSCLDCGLGAAADRNSTAAEPNDRPYPSPRCGSGREERS